MVYKYGNRVTWGGRRDQPGRSVRLVTKARRERTAKLRLTGTRRIDIVHRKCDTGGSDGDT